MVFRVMRALILCVGGLIVFVASARGQYVAPAGFIESIGNGNWDQPSTWLRSSGSGSLPTAGDVVKIKDLVTLNTNAGIADLARIELHGQLTVADTQNYDLGVSRFEILEGGHFVVGTSGTRFAHRFTLTLTDSWLSPEYQHAEENRTLFVESGSLDMHGDQSVPGGGVQASWLRLQSGANAGAGDVAITLEAAPGWNIGDQIVIASTDFDHLQAERRGVAAISGNVVTLDSPLTYHHHGTIEFGVVDERAEVGLLSRNVQIVGPASAATSQRGGHCIFVRANGGPAPMVRLDWVELHHLGWFGAKGRYPIHIHEVGTVSHTYVASCSVWQSFNRAIAVHNSNDVVIEGNVVYDTYGHAYYLEDGRERGNELRGNLGLVTKVPPLTVVTVYGDSWAPTGGAASPFFTPSDAEVSTFWIPNTDNTFHDNVAAGSARHGIWYDIQPPGVPAVLPPRFERNVAHSNGENGFHNETARYVPHDPALGNPFTAVAEFKDFTAYKNRNAGIWNRAFGVTRWIRARIADNQVGVYFASEGFQLDFQNYLAVMAPSVAPFSVPIVNAPTFSLQTLEDSDVIGDTNNRGTPQAPLEMAWSSGSRSLAEPTQPQYELKGIEMYDGLIGLIDVRFRNFLDWPLPTGSGLPGGVWTSYTHRAAMAIGARDQHTVSAPGSPWSFDPRNFVENCTFVDVDHPVLFPVPHPADPCSWIGLQNKPVGANACYGNGIENSVVFDRDGCILGDGVPAWWANDRPLVRPSGSPAPTAVMNLPDYREPLRVAITDAQPMMLGQFVLEMGSACGVNPVNQAITFVTVRSATRSQQADVYDAHRSACASPKRRFPTNLLLGPDASNPETYEVSYPTGASASTDPRDLECWLQFSEGSRTALFRIPYGGTSGGPPQAPSAVRMSCPALFGNTFVLAPSLSSLSALKSATAGVGFYFDGAHLWLRPELTATVAAFAPVTGRAIKIEVDG